ncbi:MAG: DotU family type IV/VI secretion system protein [Holosporaceae bacterium]|nr:MAG: DotU family type IV/VI secretion system protein [Holosporaceae bacterium]
MPNQKEAAPQPKPAPSTDHQSVAQEIRERLEAVLTGQYRELGSSKGGYAARYYEEAQYIMVSLADEMFINLNWAGKEEWEDNLLESLMYNTQDAGDKFFENLDMFLDRGHSSQTTDMAALYLIALGLGFKGKYRDAEYEGTLAKYKERLYRYITSEDPQLLYNQSHLFPESYTNIIGDRQSVQMPNIRTWWISLCVIGVGFVIGSSIIWLHHMQRFSPLVDALQKWAEV